MCFFNFPCKFFIGGNAALIAQKLAAMTSDDGKVLLCVPLGPKLETVLHPLLVTPDNSAIDDDEYHLILEYGKDERCCLADCGLISSLKVIPGVGTKA